MTPLILVLGVPMLVLVAGGLLWMWGRDRKRRATSTITETTSANHKARLARAKELVASNPSLLSPAGEELAQLAESIEAYEKEAFPLREISTDLPWVASPAPTCDPFFPNPNMVPVPTADTVIEHSTHYPHHIEHSSHFEHHDPAPTWSPPSFDSTPNTPSDYGNSSDVGGSFDSGGGHGGGHE